jgi:F0F1-type ATP synthase assembly protein I
MNYSNQYLVLGKRVIILELMIALIFVVAITGISQNINTALSALFGAGLVILSTLVYFYVAFRKGVIANSNIALKRHKMAMILKFSTNVLGFALILAIFKNCNFIVFIAAYIITLSGYWLSLIKK